MFFIRVVIFLTSLTWLNRSYVLYKKYGAMEIVLFFYICVVMFLALLTAMMAESYKKYSVPLSLVGVILKRVLWLEYFILSHQTVIIQ